MLVESLRADLPWLHSFDVRDALVVREVLDAMLGTDRSTDGYRRAEAALALSCYFAAWLRNEPGDAPRGRCIVDWLCDKDLELPTSRPLPLAELEPYGWRIERGGSHVISLPLGWAILPPPERSRDDPAKEEWDLSVPPLLHSKDADASHQPRARRLFACVAYGYFALFLLINLTLFDALVLGAACDMPPPALHSLPAPVPRPSSSHRRDPRHVAARSARAARPRRAVRRPRPRNLQRRRDPRLALALLHAHLALRPAHAQPRQFRVARRVPRPAAPLPCNRLLPRRGQRRGAGLVARDGAAGGQGPHLRRVERGLPVPVVARLVPRPRRHRRRGRAARPLGTRLCLLRHALGRAAGRDADGAHAVPRAEGRRAAHADARRRVGRLAAEAGAAD
mmetsp:Transcript_11422/g.38072  ORF Transcript_11422/g.38072 Transcript_11422/m.38072 type:complete len:394 (+) Transcript_11422:222-1403(+)